MREPLTELLKIQPYDLVADAVMLTWAGKITDIVREHPQPVFSNPTFGENDPEILFKRATEFQCVSRSADVAFFLARKNPDTFNKFLIVSSCDFSDESWLKKAGMDVHAYFLVQDYNGCWYAGSPANHGANRDEKYATTIYSERSLESLLRIIEKRDIMSLPKANDILKALEVDSGVRVTRQGKFDCYNLLSVSKKNGSTSSEYRPCLWTVRGVLKS